MPVAIRTVCSYPGCGKSTTGARCSKHAEQTKRERSERRRKADAARASSSDRGYGSKWRKARDEYLRLNPWCVECQDEGVQVAAIAVDHRVPCKPTTKEFWRRSNWQSLCRRHHSRKTARQDGAFGNPIRQGNTSVQDATGIDRQAPEQPGRGVSISTNARRVTEQRPTFFTRAKLR